MCVRRGTLTETTGPCREYQNGFRGKRERMDNHCSHSGWLDGPLPLSVGLESFIWALY